MHGASLLPRNMRVCTSSLISICCAILILLLTLHSIAADDTNTTSSSSSSSSSGVDLTNSSSSSSSSTGLSNSSSSNSTNNTHPYVEPEIGPQTDFEQFKNWTIENCSARNATCLRIGLFRCTGQESRRQYVADHCGEVRGYNEMLLWYMIRVRRDLGGYINGLPVLFRVASLSPGYLAQTRLDRLVAKTFFDRQGNALVDYVILPPGMPRDILNRFEDPQRGTSVQLVPSVAPFLPLSDMFLCSSDPLAASVQGPRCYGGSEERRYIYLHGISNPAELYMEGWFTLLHLREAKSVGIITDAYRSSYELLQLEISSLREAILGPTRYGVAKMASDAGMTVVYNEVVDVAAVDSVTARESLMMAAVDAIRETDPDAIMLVTQYCRDWLKIFRRMDYIAKSVALTHCENMEIEDKADTDLGLPPLLLFSVISFHWDHRMTGSDFSELGQQPWSFFSRNATLEGASKFSTPTQFTNLWQNLTGYSYIDDVPTSAEASILASFSYLEGVLSIAPYTLDDGVTPYLNPRTVNFKEMDSYYDTSFYGILNAKGGMNTRKQMVSLQYELGKNDWSIISPQSSASLDFIYPIPTWSERIYVQKEFGRFFIDYIVSGFIILCGTATLILVIALLISHNRFITYSLAIDYYILIALGCLCSYSSLLTWNVEHVELQCRTRIWLWTLGFHLVVGPMLGATKRMYDIMNGARINSNRPRPNPSRGVGVVDQDEVTPTTSTSAPGIRVSTRMMSQKVGLYILLYIAPQLAINLIWTYAYGGLVLELIVSDPLRASLSYTACTFANPDVGNALFLLTASYCFFLLIYGVVLTWRIRRSVAATIFVDSRSIALSFCLFSMTIIVVWSVQLSLQNRRRDPHSQSTLFAYRSFGTLIAYQLCFAFLIGMRLFDSGCCTRKTKANVPKAQNIELVPRIGLASDALKTHASEDPPLPLGLRSNDGLHSDMQTASPTIGGVGLNANENDSSSQNGVDLLMQEHHMNVAARARFDSRAIATSAEVSLPHCCYLPPIIDLRETLDNETTQLWRAQLMQHLEEIEKIVPIKIQERAENEEPHIRMRAPTYSESSSLRRDALAVPRPGGQHQLDREPSEMMNEPIDESPREFEHDQEEYEGFHQQKRKQT